MGLAPGRFGSLEAVVSRLSLWLLSVVVHRRFNRQGWVRVDEQRWSGYGKPEIPLHFHALLKYQNVPAPEAVAGLWKSKAGNARVEIYDPARGAA